MNRLSNDPAVRLAECRGERNQCDGCQAGIPVEIGRLGGLMHRMGKPGGYEDRMSCTAHLYAAPAFDEAAERRKAKQEWIDVQPDYPDLHQFTAGWLACAKSRAEVK